MSKHFKIGYAIGLVVGEGSFTDDKGKSPTLSVKLHEDDPEPLLFLKSFLGGKIYGPYHHSQKEGPERKYFLWHLKSHQLRKALPLFLAYLPPSRKRQQFFTWSVRHHLLVSSQQELMFHVAARPKHQPKRGDQLRLVV